MLSIAGSELYGDYIVGNNSDILATDIVIEKLKIVKVIINYDKVSG